MTKTRIASAVLGLALVAGFAAPAEAQTVAQLQAQIQALMAQLAALSGGSVTAGANFTQNLTVGSTGSQVVALQQMLVAQGHLVMPAGVAYGYFGPATKAAVVKWQLANGISPASGYFGPLSRAKANASGGTTVGGTVGGGATAGGTISTPGVEGTLTAELAPVPGAGQTLREGDDKKAILGVELEAKLSDIKIERIKVKLDQASGGTADRDLYREIADKMYVMSGSTVIASVDLNSTTVVEETTGNYYVTVAGLNYIVPKDSERTLTIALDAQASFDSTEEGDTWTLTIPTEGIRGVDGAGVNQYGPSSGTLARTFTSAADEADSASLVVSLNASSPDAREVIAATGADEDEADEVELLKFNVRAEDDAIEVTDVVVAITRGGNTSTATATTAYLYDGSTLLGSASVAGTSLTAMTATFDDVSVNVADGATKALTVKIDVADAGTAATTFSASVTGSTGVTAENSKDDAVTPSGSATSETLVVRKIGPEFTLVSKSITKGATPESGNQSTSTATATFVLRIKAVGGDILFGTAASTTPIVATDGIDGSDDDPSFRIYLNGALTTLDVASSTSFDTPSGVTVASETWTLTEGQTIELPVTYLFEGRDDDSGAAVSTGSYAVGLAQLNWVSSAGLQTSDFMAGETAWRTSAITLP